VTFFVLALISCSKKPQEPSDHPRLTARVTMVDVRFYSNALGREMPYRIILPTKLSAGKKLPVLYLLHGGGGGFRDWSNYSDVAGYAEKGLILVMPEGNSSYYVNSADHPQDRYEDYITHDLIADVEDKFPAATGRANRAIAGVSMGGFGAVTLALKHSDLFVFAGGLSSALDVPSRPFSIKRLGQWRQHRSIFGPWKSQHQHENDPMFLVRSAAPGQTPYFFLTCGDQEGLLAVNRKFAALLQERHFSYEFRTAPGGHDWNQWNSRVPDLIDSLTRHIAMK
jgi:putative tributyrin esterase